MKEISFDILCINETRLDNTINDNIIKIAGYDIVRRDRDRNGGGVAIYIRNIISYKNHIEFIPDNLESICLEIQKPKSKPLLIRDFNPQNTCSCHVIKFVNKSRNADNEQFNMVATKRCALGGL
jgi:exonuclease III